MRQPEAENDLHYTRSVLCGNSRMEIQMEAVTSETIGAAVVLQQWGGVPSWIAQRLRAFGPYVVIELLLPGGTLISLLLYLYRRRGSARALAASEGAVLP